MYTAAGSWQQLTPFCSGQCIQQLAAHHGLEVVVHHFVLCQNRNYLKKLLRDSHREERMHPSAVCSDFKLAPLEAEIVQGACKVQVRAQQMNRAC